MNQKLVLPERVKEIMRRSSDETNLTKMELLLNAVRREIEGETRIYMTSEQDIEELSKAIGRCTSKFYDEVGAGSRVPEGAR